MSPRAILADIRNGSLTFILLSFIMWLTSAPFVSSVWWSITFAVAVIYLSHQEDES
jgi:hypothetical protein